MTVVEVVPLVASAAPVIVGGGIVGAVVGVLGLLVESTGLGVLNERLGVEVGSLLSVEDSAHLTRIISGEQSVSTCEYKSVACVNSKEGNGSPSEHPVPTDIYIGKSRRTIQTHITQRKGISRRLRIQMSNEVSREL